MRSNSSTQRSSPPEFLARSADSLAFEEFWQGLRQGKRIPDRDDFNPAHAVRFLRDLVLLEAPRSEPSALRVRLVGTSIDIRVGRNISGCDYLDFVPPQFHRGVLVTAKLMREQPCGLWQVMPIHYEKRIAQQAEVTAFPLAPAQNGNPLIITLLKFPGRPVSAVDIEGKAMMVETATQYEFIDVGGGIPIYTD